MDQGVGNRALIKRFWTLGCNGTQGSSQVGVSKNLPGIRRLSAGQEDRGESQVFLERRSILRPNGCVHFRYWYAILGHRDGRLEIIRQSELAEPFLQRSPSRYRARHGDRMDALRGDFFFNAVRFQEANTEILGSPTTRIEGG